MLNQHVIDSFNAHLTKLSQDERNDHRGSDLAWSAVKGLGAAALITGGIGAAQSMLPKGTDALYRETHEKWKPILQQRMKDRHISDYAKNLARVL